MPSTWELKSIPEMVERRPQAARRRMPPTGTASGSPAPWRPSPTGRWRFLADASTAVPVAPNPIVVSRHPPDGEAKNHAIV